MVALLYSFFFRYNVAAFSNMNNNKDPNNNDNVYSWSIDPSKLNYVNTNSAQPPFTFIVLLVAIAFLVVGIFLVIQDSQ